jgi:hypothetical protein
VIADRRAFEQRNASAFAGPWSAACNPYLPMAVLVEFITESIRSRAPG